MTRTPRKSRALSFAVGIGLIASIASTAFLVSWDDSARNAPTLEGASDLPFNVSNLNDVTEPEIVYNAPESIAGTRRSPVFEILPIDGMETKYSSADAAELISRPETGALDVFEMVVDGGLEGVNAIDARRGVVTDLVLQSRATTDLPHDAPGPENVLKRPAIIVVARGVPVMSVTGGLYDPDAADRSGRQSVGVFDLVFLFDANDGHFLEVRNFLPGEIGP